MLNPVVIGNGYLEHAVTARADEARRPARARVRSYVPGRFGTFM